MRDERGQVAGNVVVYEPYTLWGSVGGDVKVVTGGKLYVRGSVYGSVIVEEGGRVHVLGNIMGDLVLHRRTKVIMSGRLGGDAINDGGRLYIDEGAKIGGSVKTLSGETKYQTAADIADAAMKAGNDTDDHRVSYNPYDETDHRKRLRGSGIRKKM